MQYILVINNFSVSTIFIYEYFFLFLSLFKKVTTKQRYQEIFPEYKYILLLGFFW